MNTEKIKELLKNEDFIKELAGKNDAEDVRACFAQNGFDLSLDEVKALGRVLGAVLKADGELSEDELALAAGGDTTRITIPKWMVQAGHDIAGTAEIVSIYAQVYGQKAWDFITSW